MHFTNDFFFKNWFQFFMVINCPQCFSTRVSFLKVPAVNSYCIRLSGINPPDLEFYLPLARSFKLQFGTFLLVVIPVCSVTQGPEVKTKLKIKEPKLKQDCKRTFLSELFLSQVSGLVYTSVCTGTVQGLCSRKEQARDKERLAPPRGGNSFQTFLIEFFEECVS